MEERASVAAKRPTAPERGICEECGRRAVIVTSLDPESPLSGSLRLCPSCARSPAPYWHDDR